jgi:CBS domain-containing protein
MTEAETDNSVPKETVEEKDYSDKPVAETISSPVENATVTGKEQSGVSSDVKQEPSNDAIGNLRGLCARDIMQKNILWCSSEEGMGEVLAKMCQGDKNYALIGRDDTPEGIVSMSDLRAGMSPYLRPEFAKWRRPIDDASLRIKVRWLMSKNVHTVKSHDCLSDVATSMCRLGLRSMPVVNQKGQIEGLVNVFDVLRTLSHSDIEVASNK